VRLTAASRPAAIQRAMFTVAPWLLFVCNQIVSDRDASYKRHIHVPYPQGAVVTAQQEQYRSACESDAAAGRAIRDCLDRVGDKWSMLVIAMLREQPLRFTELQRRVVGVSQRMLTLNLRQLERDGLVTRTVHAEVPPRVEYALTELGRTLLEPVTLLAAWALDHYEDVTANRQAYDEAHPA